MDHKKRITGVVVSDKSAKTIVVQMEGYRKHPKYNIVVHGITGISLSNDKVRL